MSILDRERSTYEDMWTGVSQYGDHAPGEHFLPIFLHAIGKVREGHILDAGTGSGKGAVALSAAGFRVTMCDVTDTGLIPQTVGLPFYQTCLWHSLRPITPAGSFDWVYCTDVLEHLPTQFTMLAVEQMLRVSLKGLFISVSLTADSFGAYLGKPLHQTVQPYKWWLDSIRELGYVADSRDLLNSATFYVKPR